MRYINQRYLLTYVVIRELDLRLEIAGSIPARLRCRVRPWEQVVYKHVPLSPSSITWYQRKLGSKQAHRAAHYSPVFMVLQLRLVSG